MYLIETLKYLRTVKFITIFALLLLCNVVSATPADTVKINARNGEAGEKSIYELYFSVEQEITPNASVVVSFPEDFDLSGVTIASSTTINGGFEVSVNNSSVILKRTGLGKSIPPNEKVNIKFANVKNPDSAVSNQKVTIEIRNDNNQTVLNRQEEIQVVPNASK